MDTKAKKTAKKVQNYDKRKIDFTKKPNAFLFFNIFICNFKDLKKIGGQILNFARESWLPNSKIRAYK